MAIELVAAAVARLSSAVDQVEQLCEENRRLRTLLWASHACTKESAMVLGDDLQCTSCSIDFKRAPIDAIEGRLQLLALDRLMLPIGDVNSDATGFVS
jgi:hypothetical protein